MCQEYMIIKCFSCSRKLSVPIERESEKDHILCSVCESRKEYFDALDKLTLDERVRAIEVWIYNHRTPIHYPTPILFK